MQRLIQAFFAIILISCSSDNNEIVGTWRTIDTYDEFTGDEINTRFIFKEDNDFINPDDEFNEVDLRGTYKFENSTLSINYQKGTGTKYQIQKLTDSLLILIEDPGTGYQQTYKFRKIADDQPKKDTLNC